MIDLISTAQLSMFLSSFLTMFILCFLFFSLGSLCLDMTSIFKEQQQHINVQSDDLWVISIIFIFLCIL